MQLAELKMADIHLQYRCPNCYLHFGLRNKQIPTKKEVKIKCPACYDMLTVLPMNIKIEKLSFESNKEKKIPPKQEIINRAVAALTSQGFGKREAQGLILSVYDESMTLPDLIVTALRIKK